MSCHVGLDCMALIFVKRTCLKAAALPFKAKPHSLSMLQVRRKSKIKLKGYNVFDEPYFILELLLLNKELFKNYGR